eukprot:m.200048 g.200048  ORF g.200048 m.200048 type:complete len:443 (-) comp32758_c1_seq1:231-1559(-)
MKNKKASGKGMKAPKNQPLGQQIQEASAPKQKIRVKAGKKKGQEKKEFVDPKASQRILDMAKQQQDDEAGPAVHNVSQIMTPQSEAFDFDGSDVESDGEVEAVETFYEELNINDEDDEALKMFMPSDAPKQATLADIILGKIKEKETEIASQYSVMEDTENNDTYKPPDPKIVSVFDSVGKILKKYRSGKFPKAFKIIPNLVNWEEILYLTEPDGWSAAAMFQATRVFASNLKSKMAQRFYNLVLLPRVRDDIADYKKLNFHLYQAVAKSLYKPGAFFKGILIPLCQGGDCSLREAVIIASIMSRNSIPVLHSSAAMLQLAEMPYNGANSIFLRVLLDKKYALPYRVIDGLVFHFYRFTSDPREMPVLWHQCLLIFMQRYKQDCTTEQKESLLALLRKHKHHSITDDIRREIVLSRSRDNEVPMERDPAIAFADAAATDMEV